MFIIGILGVAALGKLWAILGLIAYNGGLDLGRTISFTVTGFIYSSIVFGYLMYRLYKKER